MGRVIELTDDQYRAIEDAARAKGQTLDALVAAWIEELRDLEPRYYETEEWFRHLGATEEQITEARRIARERGDADAR